MDNVGEQRFHEKRKAGISETRRDGSKYNLTDDRHGYDFEEYAAGYFGQETDKKLYGRKGDGGIDFRINGVTVDAYMIVNPRGRNLIINPNEAVYPDIYIVGKRDADGEFEFAGWITHDELVAMPKEDFGFGLKYACKTDKLHDVEILKDAWDTSDVA